MEPSNQLLGGTRPVSGHASIACGLGHPAGPVALFLALLWILAPPVFGAPPDQAPPPQACELLEDADLRGMMSGLRLKLELLCGRDPSRERVLGQGGPPSRNWSAAGSTDVKVSLGPDDFPVPATPYSSTQNSTALAVAPPASGPGPEILCSVYNDGYHLVVEEEGFNGFSRSTDGGASWEDNGALVEACGSSCMPKVALGDPSVVWSETEGEFLIAALEADGIGLWSSSECSTVQFVGNPHTAATVDRPFLAVDDHDTSPHEGRIHIVWTGFDAGTRIFHRQSDDGGATWTVPMVLSPPGADVQAAWPEVAADGSLLVAWTRWSPFPNGDLGIDLVRVDEDGGGNLQVTALTPPMSGQVNPRDAAATTIFCGQPALPGNIRYVPASQLAIDTAGNLHVVYSYDPDGYNVGDVVDVFYRRSTDGGVSWGSEVELDTGVDDLNEYFPTISVGPSSFVSATWYESEQMGGPDCEMDPCWWEQTTHRRISYDGGVSWSGVETVSDEPSLIAFDPLLPTCYHGDYDQQVQTADALVMQWADDRELRDCDLAEANCCDESAPGCCDLEAVGDPDCPGPPWSKIPDADVWTERVEEDYRFRAEPPSRDLCIPAVGTESVSYDLDFFWFQGFAEDVDLSAPPPAGTVVTFLPDPVPNGGSSTLSVEVSPAAVDDAYPILISADSTSTAVHREAVALLNLYQLPPALTGLEPVPGTTLDTLQPTLSWDPEALASAYEVEVATDSAFADVVFSATVPGTSVMVDQALESATVYYWRARATNSCGAGPFLATLHDFTTRSVPKVLVVDDDDNSPDVFPYYGPVLDGLLGPEGTGYDVWDTMNSNDEPPADYLALYAIVIWFTGNEFGGFAGPGEEGEMALAEWLDDQKGCLLLTSQDYHFDRGLTDFMQDYLGVESVVNDTEQTIVDGQGELFGGLGGFTLAYPYDNLSDTLTGDATSETAFDGDLGVAALQKLNQPWSTIYAAFPLEALPSSAALSEVLDAALETRCRGKVILQDDFEYPRCFDWDYVFGGYRCDDILPQ